MAYQQTSREAYQKIEPHVTTLKERVYYLIRKSGRTGITDEELQDGLDINPSTERPRRIELVAEGHVSDIGLRRLTHSGRKAIAWVATAVL